MLLTQSRNYLLSLMLLCTGFLYVQAIMYRLHETATAGLRLRLDGLAVGDLTGSPALSLTYFLIFCSCL
jgi:hypothetical protein